MKTSFKKSSLLCIFTCSLILLTSAFGEDKPSIPTVPLKLGDILITGTTGTLDRVAPGFQIELDLGLMGLYRGHYKQALEDLRPLLWKDIYYRNLWQIPALIADLERRIKNEESPDPVKDMDSVAGLIRELENVAVLQMSDPGWADPIQSETVRKLIAHGEAAMEPLLECLENDDRLTRSLNKGRISTTWNHAITVRTAAFRAIQGILQTADPGHLGPWLGGGFILTREQGQTAATAIRAYWEPAKGLSNAERWYKRLADDSLPPECWIFEAGYIVETANVNDSGGAIPVLCMGSVGDRKDQYFAAPTKGESLRAKTAPTVSELLIKRMNYLIQHAAGNGGRHLDHACRFAWALAMWDGKAHKDELAAFREKLLQTTPTAPAFREARKRMSEMLEKKLTDFTETNNPT